MRSYTVVVVLTVEPHQILKFSSHFSPTSLHVAAVVFYSSSFSKETTLHIKANHDCYKYVEDENVLESTAPLLFTLDTRNVTCFFHLFGKQGTGHAHGLITFLSPKAFLARLAISCWITCSAFRLTPRVKPAFNPLRVILFTFKGFRVLLSPSRPPRNISANTPLPSCS